MRKEPGFTLIEVTIILLVLSILSMILLPQLGHFNRLARFVKAREDVGALCASMKKLLDEVFQGAFYENAESSTTPIGLLFGPGALPAGGGAVGNGSGTPGGAPPAGTHDGHWLLTGGSFVEAADNGTVDLTFSVGELENHLIQNDPDGDGNAAEDDQDYPNTFHDQDEHVHGETGVGFYFGWKGPYFDSLTPDPWGNRYAANVFALHSPNSATAGSIYTSAVACYSAGPNQLVDTFFNQPQVDAGWSFGNEDIGAILSAGGPF